MNGTAFHPSFYLVILVSLIDLLGDVKGIEKSVPPALRLPWPVSRSWSYAQPLVMAGGNSCGNARQTPKCKPVRSLYVPKRLTVKIDAKPARRSQSPVEYHYVRTLVMVLLHRS